MNRTSIEWTDFTWNPVTGCRRDCDYCYARKIAHRFAGSKAFPNGFEPTFHPERLAQPFMLKKPSKIFVCSIGELFGSWVPKQWTRDVIRQAIYSPWHIFQFLTKSPENLSLFPPFPSNCWVGATATDQEMTDHALEHLAKVDTKVKFVSFEPLLGPVRGDFTGLQWAIIGGQTNPGRLPKLEWVSNLTDDLGRNDVPVFMKRNAGPFAWDWEPRWPA